MSLPRGTVTFMFTDVEGSTALLQRLGDDYTRILGEHREALRAAVAAVGGSEVDCRGDELFAVFSDASAAVRAAFQAQREGVDAIRVRIGLHTGTATVSDGAYYGLDVHRAARICAAAHGGQVVLSDAACEAAEASAVELGEYRLRGLPHPERLFQLVGEGLEREFPPLRTESPKSEIDTGEITRRPRRRLRPPARGRSRGCSRTPASACVGQAGDADDLLLKVRSYRPGRRDRRHPHAADAHRRGPARGQGDPRASTPTPACSCSRSTSSRRTRWSCSPTAPRASATC